MKTRAAYLAAEGFVAELAHELGPVEFAHERLLLAPGPPRLAAWAQNVWLDPEIIPVASIGDAARRLRAIQRNWAVYAPRHHRRAMLIRDRLPSVSAKPLVFGEKPPEAPLGSWTLLDPNTLLAAPHCTSAFPNGEIALCRGPHRTAEPGISETLGGADADRTASRPRRCLPRSRQQPRRLELGADADGRARDQRR